MADEQEEADSASRLAAPALERSAPPAVAPPAASVPPAAAAEAEAPTSPATGEPWSRPDRKTPATVPTAPSASTTATTSATVSPRDGAVPDDGVTPAPPPPRVGPDDGAEAVETGLTASALKGNPAASGITALAASASVTVTTELGASCPASHSRSSR